MMHTWVVTLERLDGKRYRYGGYKTRREASAIVNEIPPAMNARVERLHAGSPTNYRPIKRNPKRPRTPTLADMRRAYGSTTKKRAVKKAAKRIPYVKKSMPRRVAILSGEKYKVQYQQSNGGAWITHASFGNKSSATEYGKMLAKSHPEKTFRIFW